MIREYLVRWLLKEERPKIFALAQKDMMETMADDLDRQAESLSQRKLANLLSIINEEDIIATKGNALYLGGEPADAQRVANLKAEADFFMASDLWKVINETPKELAQRALFVDDGKSEVVHTKGRSMLFLLATQNKIIKTLQSLSTPTNT